MFEIDDHRSLGQRLDLWHFEDEAPGMVFWHPRGYVLYRLLEQAARARLAADGYAEVRSPQILRRPVWEASGHWQHFGQGMFHLADETREAAVKPVSCPGHIQIARRLAGSYRDLPLRLGELGLVHRDEPSGTLHGLLRLRQFTQDDGHVFCDEDQIAGELDRFCRSVAPFYRSFGFQSLGAALSTRPAERAGGDADWDRAEKALAEALARLGLGYEVQPGAGAFYGPKIEFALEDRASRAWQCGTIQLDLVMPGRFDLRHVGKDGLRHPTVMIHRALYGSLERFIAILLEHHRGALPAWLAPIQVRVLPVSPAARAYAALLRDRLAQAGLRVELDEGRESLARQVQNAHADGVAMAAVVGEREAAEQSVSLRVRGQSERGGRGEAGGVFSQRLPLAIAIAQLAQRCAPPVFS